MDLPRLDSSAPIMTRLRPPLWVLDVDALRVVWTNPAALAFLGATSPADLDRGDLEPGIVRYVRDLRDELALGQLPSQSGMHTFHRSGTPVTARISISGIVLDDGRVGLLHEIVHDASALAAADADNLRAIDALLYTSLMISLYGGAGPALYSNPAATTSLVPGLAALRERFVDVAVHDALIEQVERKREGRVVAQIYTRFGVRWHDVVARSCHDAGTGKVALLVSETDVSELKQAEAQATHLACHDHLTGLPNRAFVATEFAARIDALHAEPDDDADAALIFIDVDRFKQVNDTFGHEAGDELLKGLADRLQLAAGPGDLIARLGGDEFIILTSAPELAAHVTALTSRIGNAAFDAIAVGGTELTMTTSVGVAWFPRDGAGLDELLRHADLAMYAAKSQGRNQIRFFSPDLEPRLNQLTLEGELRRALRDHEFVVYYQPRVEASSSRVLGAEALVRWNHPVRGLVMPGEFVPACEDIGLIGELGSEVLRLVVQQQVAWRLLGQDVKVSVNLSPSELRRPDLGASMAELVHAHGGDPSTIELEITESVLLGDQPATARTLEAVRAAGFRIAVDDFGTGYSNLAYLHRYPIDSLKIDRLFVQASERGLAIAATVLAICRALDVTPVAEGVETDAQLAWLVAHGCGEYQGFLYSPAVPAAAFFDLVTRAQA